MTPRLGLILALAAGLIAPAPARAQEVRSADVYFQVEEPGIYRLGNSRVERVWVDAAAEFFTVSLLDKETGREHLGGPSLEFTFGVANRSITSIEWHVSDATAVELPRGGIAARIALQNPGFPGITVVRRVELGPRHAVMRVRTTVLNDSYVPLPLHRYTLDQLYVPTGGGRTAPAAEAHHFVAGSDWRADAAADYRRTTTAPPGQALDANAEWLTLDAGGEGWFFVMERRDYPSSRMIVEPGTSTRTAALVDLHPDVVFFGPFEEDVHAENPLPRPAQPRARLVPIGGALEMEPVAVGVYHGGRLEAAWEHLRYLRQSRSPRYAGRVTFNSNRIEFRRGAKDELDHTSFPLHAGIAERLGVETFILDDGWQLHSGDWEADPARWPQGLAGVAADLHARNMRLGLWMTPLAFHPSSRAFRDHPEWSCVPVGTATAAANAAALAAGDTGGSNEAGIGLWNTTEALLDHLGARVDALVTADAEYFKLDFLLWLDCLAPPVDLYEYHDAFFRWLDRTQERHPGVLFQLDETNDFRGWPFEAVARGPVWFENGGSLSLLLHDAWLLSPYVPTFALGLPALDSGAWTQGPGGEWESKGVPLDTRMAAALLSHMTFWWDENGLPDGVVEAARPWVAFYRGHPDLLADALTIPLLEDPLTNRWTAFQTADLDTGAGLLLAFRQGDDRDSATIALPGVPAGGRYLLRDPLTGEGWGTFDGGELREGIEVSAPPQGAVVLEVSAA